MRVSCRAAYVNVYTWGSSFIPAVTLTTIIDRTYRYCAREVRDHAIAKRRQGVRDIAQ